MLVKGSKWDAAEALLKTIIIDRTLYCYNCGDKYKRELSPCCSDPLIDTWAGHLRKLVSEIAESNKLNSNRFGSIKGKAMRSCLSLPPALMLLWSRAFKATYNEDLLRTNNPKLYKLDVRAMMRRFPMFRRCETI